MAMKSEEIRYDAYKHDDPRGYSWIYCLQGEVVGTVSFIRGRSESCVLIRHLSGKGEEMFFARYDRAETIAPGIRRTVRRVSDGERIGYITFSGFCRSSINEHILVRSGGLQTVFYDSRKAGNEPIARCHLYNDRGTAFLQTTRREANCFSVYLMEEIDAKDRMLILLQPVIGFG